MRYWVRILVLLLPVAVAAAAHAQGGPPFITDDPGTPGNHHWEINFGWIANHNPGQSYYEIPDVDMNYGWGDKVQLKYELPVAGGTDTSGGTGFGLGESLIGIKMRPYEYHTRGEAPSDDNMLFSLGFYPQVSINNPTSSVRRGIVEPGPQYYLPMEMTAKWGPVEFDGEIGRWIGNANQPEQWGRGLIAGHEFNDRLELYGELYDLQAIDKVRTQPKQRSLTLDFGGRQSLDKQNHIRLLFMGGRAIQKVTAQNGEPSWIAYLGVQFLLGPKEKEVPGEKP
ncbi:MAG: hypothetical protein ABR928_12430 [Terracidiphilus sp.]|jgi:hypothetical protein